MDDRMMLGSQLVLYHSNMSDRYCSKVPWVLNKVRTQKLGAKHHDPTHEPHRSQ